MLEERDLVADSAPVPAGRDPAVVYVGIVALSRGITELFLAFKFKDLNRRIAAS